MNIKVNKWVLQGDINHASYKVISIDKCCDRILQSENICLNNELDSYDSYFDDDSNNYGVKLIHIGVEYDDDCPVYDSYEAINYCPFCGKPINIELMNTIDKTEEVNKLQEERDTLWNKYNKLDSIKKRTLLRAQVDELDKQINYLYESDGFPEEDEINGIDWIRKEP